jgi:TOMM system kinase/cyclase fusion protein
VEPIQAIREVLQGRYEILSELGEGGFGTVYKALQLATGQAVAVKVLRLPEGASVQAHEKRIARFQREMQICAQMHHPNIVRLMDSGQAAGGVVYSVFSFVPGKNLGEVLAEEGGLDPVEARYFMLQALDALACAHAENVVHRDFKPANIMIIPTGARRNALILDFGIGALTQETRREEGARLTLTNESIGTPSYAAPEQLRGLPLTPRSDLYAWGLVFLECLSGKRVVDGATVAEVVFKQLSADPIPLPESLANHPLGHILRRVTAKEPEARNATAASLLRELEACDVSGLRQRTTVGHPAASFDATTATLNIEGLPPSTPRALRLVEGERRQITAVCCSLTARSLGAKPVEMEELDQLLGVEQEACIAVARRFDGHVAGALGDAVLFYFGYPTAREDDARRAARAALAMLAEIARAQPTLEAERKVRIDLRIGIHTGLVVARELREPTLSGLGYVVGGTPKIASRLGPLADPGSILVSSTTQRLLRKEFVFDASPIRINDDSTAPVDIFTLREGDPAAGFHEVPLVGRAQELATLLDRWDRVRGGEGQAVLIGGEPGIGKSRLARELAERIGDEPHAWLECRCTPDSATSAFYPIVDLLSRLLDPERTAAPEAKITRLEALLSRYGFELPEAMPLFAPLLAIPMPAKWAALDVSPQKQRELTRDAVLALLFEMAEKAPVALLIEDLHWADPSTLELLGQLVTEVGSARVLALFTARPELTPPWSPAAVLQLQLGRFGRAEVEQMAAKITSNRALPAEVLEQIASRTDGVPLFVEELVLSLIETGALVEKDGAYALAKPLAEVEIPATLRDSLMARLDRLGRAKETAQIAAAIGRELTFELLRAVSPLSEADAQEDLDRLVAAELMSRKRRLKNPAYLFKHALVRDAAYDSLLKRSREQIHARIAAALEEKFPEITSERPGLLAHHHAAAEQKVTAIKYAQQAAQGAIQRSAYAEAAESVRQAIGWLDAVPEGPERVDAELGLGMQGLLAVMSMRGYGDPEVAALLERSRVLLDSVGGQSPHAVPTLFATQLYHHVRAHRREARAICAQLLGIAHAAKDTLLEMASLTVLGHCGYIEGNLEESRANLERALALYDPQQHRTTAFMFGLDTRVLAQCCLSLVTWLLGYPETARKHGEAAVAWARELNHSTSVGMALLYLTGVPHYEGDRPHAIEVTSALIEIVDRYGLAMFKAFCGILRGWADNDPEAALRNVRILGATGQDIALSYWLSLPAEAEAARGNHDAAIAHLDECLRHAVAQEELYYVAELHRLKGTYLLARDPGSAPEAEACFRRAIAEAQERKEKMHELRATTHLCQLLRERGDVDEARGLLRPISGWFTEGLESGEIRAARALLVDLGG